MKVRKAIIPAAGLGTRFLPATKAQPKEMLPIVDKPTIQYIIEEAVASGIEDIIIISGRGKQTIENHFDRSIELEMELEKTGKTDYLKMVREIADMANVHYIRQKQPRGLGHAVLVAKQFIGDEPFAVLLGDDIVVSKTPCLGQMIEQFEECQSSILGVQTVPEEVVNKYKEKGYNILKVGNTESKVKQTKITNRTKQASEKVTEVKNVIKETAKTETGKDTEDVDFTITIGQDY